MAIENLLDPEIFQASDTPKLNVNLLPCKIHYDGPCNMDYFVVDDQLTSTFRGRKLIGKPLDLPPDYKLCVVSQLKNESWKMIGQATETLVWEHDGEPNGYSCPAMNLKDWVKLSDCLHEEIIL